MEEGQQKLTEFGWQWRWWRLCC